MHMEDSLSERIRWKIGGWLPDGNCVENVISRGDELSEVVRLQISHNGLDFIDRTPVVAVQAIKA